MSLHIFPKLPLHHIKTNSNARFSAAVDRILREQHYELIALKHTFLIKVDALPDEDDIMGKPHWWQQFIRRFRG